MTASRALVLGWMIFLASHHISQADTKESQNPWQALEPGLALGSFGMPDTMGENAMVRVLRIDPTRFKFELINASADNGVARSAKQWGIQKGLTAVINASLYQADYLTSVSYMRSAKHTNNNRLSKDKSLFVFDRTNESLPVAKIVDRQCEHFESVEHQYRSFVQSIRMISCDGRNVWKPSPQKHSTAAIAMDKDGKILFILARPQTDTYTLIEFLQTLPLEITRAMYVEGGPQAQLFINNGIGSYEFVGNYGSGLSSNIAWPIPNVIGIKPRW